MMSSARRLPGMSQAAAAALCYNCQCPGGVATMLCIGDQRHRTCHTLSRPAFLQVGASSVLGLSLANRLRVRAGAAESLTGSAKSVLMLWLWGGPAHLDTWDPKPNAPLEFRGPFSPIATKTTG